MPIDSKLTLFFTRGVSLSRWVESGLFDREILLYKKLISTDIFSEIILVTYGVDDLKLACKLAENNKLSREIRVFCKPSWLPGWVGDVAFSLIAPILGIGRLRNTAVFKSNQIDGAWSALIARYLLGGRYILRCGFLPSTTTIGAKSLAWTCIERFLSFSADAVLVASDTDRARIGSTSPKVKVHPTFIDTEAFSPALSSTKELKRLIFVGRIEPTKNLVSVVKAMKNTDYTLTICGEGSQKGKLQLLAKELCVPVFFQGIVPNSELPDILRKHDSLILCSSWEGTPKALLEGLSCGLVCLATDLQAIREIICDGINGYLIPSCEYTDIHKKLREVSAKDNCSVRIEARKIIVNRYSLIAFIARETEIIKSLRKH